MGNPVVVVVSGLNGLMGVDGVEETTYTFWLHRC
jgi:hypothetical protein